VAVLQRPTAIAIYFHPEAMSAAQYDEIITRLEAAGAAKPKDRSATHIRTEVSCRVRG
jgi:hypothetical protein